MWLLGPTWRTVHLVAALETVGAVLLTAGFVLSRFPVERWRLTAGLTVLVLFGLNESVFKFGAVGQPYGICLLLGTAAFRLSVLAMERDERWLAAAAGACAAGAAASSLLSAPVAAVLFVWLLVYCPPGRRIGTGCTFAAGAILPFTPSLWLLAQGPDQVIFGTIAYQLRYRQLDWPGALDHDAGVLLSWVDSGQALMLIGLAFVGLKFVHARRDWTRLQKAPYYLCGWLAVAEAVHISYAHPTFAWYYLLAAPFLAMLAPLGLFSLGARLGLADRPLSAWAPVAILGLLGLVKSVHAEWDYVRWSDYEELAARVGAVTPADVRIFADEQIYFLTHRLPPEGQAIEDSHKFLLPPAEAARLHIVPRADAYRRIKEGYFGTVVMC